MSWEKREQVLKEKPGEGTGSERSWGREVGEVRLQSRQPSLPPIAASAPPLLSCRDMFFVLGYCGQNTVVYKPFESLLSQTP